MYYLQPYQTVLKRLEGRMLLEISHDAACIKVGDDLVYTINGREAARQNSSEDLLITVPTDRGIRWKKLYGFLYNHYTSKRVPWNGKVEEHFLLDACSFGNVHKSHRADYAANRANHALYRTTKHLAIEEAHFDNYGHLSWSRKIYVPDSSKPRRKQLTAEGERQFKEQREHRVSVFLHDAALRKLKGQEEPKFRAHLTGKRIVQDVAFFRGPVNAESRTLCFAYQSMLSTFDEARLRKVFQQYKYLFAETWNLPVEYGEAL